MKIKISHAGTGVSLSITFDPKFAVLYIFIFIIKKIIIIIKKTAKKCCKINGEKSARSDSTAGLLSLGFKSENRFFQNIFNQLQNIYHIVVQHGAQNELPPLSTEESSGSALWETRLCLFYNHLQCTVKKQQQSVGKFLNQFLFGEPKFFAVSLSELGLAWCG